MSETFDIVAVGRAYTDIIAHVPAEFLELYKIPLNGDLECDVDRLKEIQASLLSPQMMSGGPSANTVATISALGGKAGFFGKIYHDEAGKSFLEDFRQRGVNLCCPAYADFPEMSATCIVLLTQEHRSFAYNRGCSDYFSKADFEHFDFWSAKFFLIEAHLLTSLISKNTIIAAIEKAKGKSRIVVNLQGITQWDSHPDMARYIASIADIVVGNEDEQSAFKKTIDLLSIDAATSQISIMTKGAKGAEIFQSGQGTYHAEAKTPKQFISSVGAGDAFIAGFLLSQAKGINIEDSMCNAVQIATMIIEETGARPTRSLTHLVMA